MMECDKYEYEYEIKLKRIDSKMLDIGPLSLLSYTPNSMAEEDKFANATVID